MTARRRAVVIGAGPAGLATAIALRGVGFDPVVYERRTDLHAAGTGLTLWPNGLAALATFGAADVVRARALDAPGTAMRSQTGRLLYEVPGPTMDSIGGRGAAIHRAELLDALAGLLDPAAVRFGVRCVGVHSDGGAASAVFDDGSHVVADLVVGADGIRSGVRADCGVDVPLRFAGFTVWRATIRFPLPPTAGLLSFGGPHQFGIWRLSGDRVYWFASAPTSSGSNAGSRPPELFAAWHEPIPALLDATPTDQITATDIYDSPPVPAWRSGRAVLVGDSAHPSLPNMGQGTSQAFEDAAVLATCLRGEPDITTALRGYERRRRRRARSASSQARMLARIGAWRSPIACALRERLMTAAPRRAQLGQLRRLFTFPG